MRGQAYKKTFTVIKKGLPPTDSLEYLEEKKERCSFNLPILASSTSTDELKNDVTSVYFGYSDIVTSVTLKLFKCDEEVATLNTSAYGTYYAFGFHTDEIKKYVGYVINWRSILMDINLGEGTYYVKAECITLTGGTYEEESFRYCLQEYTAARADGTLFFRFYHDGIIGDRNIQDDTVSYKGLLWRNGIRLRGIVLSENVPFEHESVQYTNGKRLDVKKDAEPTYTVQIDPMPYVLHKFFRNEVVNSDELYLTDYNVDCPLKPFLNVPLKHYGNYEAQWRETIKNVPVSTEWQLRTNNLRKRFC